MSVFNNGPYVGQAVRSILNQTVKDFEFLITDDASTDSTWKELETLAREDTRIRLWKRTSNQGKGNNLNVMFEQCSGDYIAFMDGDDLSFPYRFERELSVLESGQADLCGSYIINFGMGVDRITSPPSSDAAIRANLLFDFTLQHPTIMLKRHIYEMVKCRPETTPAMDYDYFVRAMPIARMYNLPEALVARRLHAGQISARRYEDQMEARLEASLLALSQMGIKPNKSERRLHLYFVSPPKHLHTLETAVPSTFDEVTATKEWVEKLAIAFRHYHYDLAFLAKYWYTYCLRASPFGLSTYRLFYAYNPNGQGTRSKLKYTIMFFMCLLRVPYHSTLFKFLQYFRKEYYLNHKTLLQKRAELHHLLHSMENG